LKSGRRPLKFEHLEQRMLLTLAPAAISDPPPVQPSAASIANCPLPVDGNSSALASAQIPSSAAAVQNSSPLNVPSHHSNPSATARLFLDFDGHFEAKWGDSKNVNTPAFDQDGNSASFSSEELAAIDEIWARVAEDFAPFNLDVTTVDPGSYKHGVVAVIAIGGDYSDWYGENAGGVAHVAGFSDDYLASNVGYVFSRTLSNVPKYIADAASHEAGHLFGLNHQSVWMNGTLLDEYNSGNSDWAPLMGTSYDSVRSTWYNGTPNTSSKVKQDDMAIIAGKENGFGYRPDDYGSKIATAAQLPVTGTAVNVSGIIGRNDDRDVWKFTTPTALVSFQLTDALVGRNLDGELELWDSSGSVIASSYPWSPSVSATLAPGTYYLVARGAGDYGDVGQYTITGALVPVTAPEIEVAVNGTPLKDSGTLDFGNTTLGQPVLKTLTVTNLGNGALTLVPFNWSQLFGAITLVSNIGDGSLDPGESTSFTLQLDATTQCALADSIQLFSNDSDEGIFDIQLRGTVNQPNVPEIDVTGDVDFGATGLGVPVTHTFTVTNLGTAPLVLQPLEGTMPQGFTLVNDLGSTLLNIGESTSFAVRLDAADVGPISGELDIANNDLDEGLLPLNLSGVINAPPAPEIDLQFQGQSIFDGGTLNFGTTLQDVAVTVTITITNLGSTWLHLTPLNPASMPSGYSLLSNIGATSLAPGEVTSIMVRFSSAALYWQTSDGIHLVSDDSDESTYDVTFQAFVTPARRQVIDDGDEDTVLAGNWRSTRSGYGRDTHYTSKGNGTRYAEWAFSQYGGVGLETGYYRVYATWTWNKHNASNAPYAMFDGDHLYYHHQIGFARVNQRVAPGPKASIGRWRYLDTVYVTSGLLEVVLMNTANGYVTADAVRIEQVTGFRSPPYVINAFNDPGATGALASAAFEPSFPATGMPQSSTQPFATAPLPRPAASALVQSTDVSPPRLAKRETSSLSDITDLLASETTATPLDAASIHWSGPVAE
jgi:hypothetical protein